MELQTQPLTNHTTWVGMEQKAEVPDIADHLTLLYDGSITRAMRNYLKTPVRIEIEPGCFAEYPDPAVAWQRDPIFRRWAIETADAMYTQNMRTMGRFNIIGYLNWVTNYDHGYMCFIQWYYRLWREDKTAKSWTIAAIRMARLQARSDDQQHPVT
ncbi:MAG: hypothetical protein AAF653_15120 [Chloroflexota bacterium]